MIILRYLLALLFAFFCTTCVYATAPIVQEATANIAATDTAITFGGSFSHIIIKTSTSAAIIYVDPNNNTATTADFQIDPGSSVALGLNGNMAATTGFHYIGASATGTISWVAW
jgi:hypothetical protein